MKIQLNQSHELQFVADIGDTEENNAFCERIAKYKLIQHGATIFIHDRQTERLLVHYNPFDNTQLICDAAGVEAANEFGAKRFLMLGIQNAAEMKAETFSRDRSFPLQIPSTQTQFPFKIANLESVLTQHGDHKEEFYTDIAKLFADSADFLPTKQDEYQSGGEQQDKYCRFHPANQTSKNQFVTEHVFLLDKNNTIIGTISATVGMTSEGKIDIYLYDEVVDYRSRLSGAEKQLLHSLQEQLPILEKNNDNADKATIVGYIKQHIAAIIEPARSHLMGNLFQAMRQQLLGKTLPALLAHLPETEQDQKIKQARAFIRAASDRVNSYEALGCGKENTGIYVIHGKPTVAAELMGSYLKETWASAQLQSLSAPKQSTQTVHRLFDSKPLQPLPFSSKNTKFDVKFGKRGFSS